MAIADAGRGITDALRENQRLDVPDDLTALKLACKPGVTGSLGRTNEFGEPRNVGQGLFQVDQIAESTNGTFVLCSGKARRVRTGDKVRFVPNTWSWKGTIVIVTLTYRGMSKYISSIEHKERMRFGHT